MASKYITSALMLLVKHTSYNGSATDKVIFTIVSLFSAFVSQASAGTSYGFSLRNFQFVLLYQLWKIARPWNSVNHTCMKWVWWECVCVGGGDHGEAICMEKIAFTRGRYVKQWTLKCKACSLQEISTTEDLIFIQLLCLYLSAQWRLTPPPPPKAKKGRTAHSHQGWGTAAWIQHVLIKTNLY